MMKTFVSSVLAVALSFSAQTAVADAKGSASSISGLAELCERLSFIPSKNWKRTVESFGLRKGDTQVFGKRLGEMILVQYANKPELPKLKKSEVDGYIASQLKHRLDPGKFSRPRRGPKDIYVTTDDTWFLFGKITARKHGNRTLEGKVGCEIISDRWISKRRAKKTAAQIANRGRKAEREEGSGNIHYRVTAYTLPEPPEIRVQIDAVRKAGNWPAFVQVKIEHAVNLLN